MTRTVKSLWHGSGCCGQHLSRQRGETAVKTGKPVPFSVTPLTTAGACLRSAGRVNEDQKTQHLCFVPDAPKKKTVRELVKASVQCRRTLLPLRALEVLKSENGIGSRPFNKALGEGLTESPGKVSLAERRPFQRSAHRTGVLALCLTLRRLPLHPCHFLTVLCALYPTRRTSPVSFTAPNTFVSFRSMPSNKEETNGRRPVERRTRLPSGRRQTPTRLG
ncbi:hypothetical protein HRbin10_02223 [bacterium HR10]|nr:hypothetical protein HRbin10_02223 [bacterium HR10]